MKAWSPEQISNRLPIDFPDDLSMRISHEAIYQSLFIEGRGGLRRELILCLRTGRALRMPRARAKRAAWAHVGTVTLIERWSGTASSGHSATGRRRAVRFQVAASVAVTSCQTVKRSAISVRHSSAVNRCRPGRKCGEMPEKADRNRCACPTEVNRFIARSRCLVG